MLISNRSRGTLAIALVLFLFSALCAGSSYALRPDEILVLANKNAAHSVGLAKYYMEKRGIAKDRLLQLWVTDKEWCTREDYDQKVVPRVRDYLKKKDPLGKIRCLVTVYGLPLKVTAPEMSREEKTELESLRKRSKILREELKAVSKEDAERRKGPEADLDEIRKRVAALTRADQRSSFDSELALVLVEDYPLKGWVLNPYFIGFRNRKLTIPREKVLLVSRLDGPTDEIVKRMIDDGIEAEKKGLKGKAYFDARWPKPKEEEVKKADMGYASYDRSIYMAAERAAKSGWMSVVVNDKPELFQPGDCPDAALYCGWYSLARYVDAFEWRPGAVGYHIASSECTTLRGKDSRVWCKMMLEDGAAATLGPVWEPYVQAFPVPEVFFGLLVNGRATLAECYAFSLPFLSWQMVLVGDPLYRPFGGGRQKVPTGRKDLP